MTRRQSARRGRDRRQQDAGTREGAEIGLAHAGDEAPDRTDQSQRRRKTADEPREHRHHCLADCKPDDIPCLRTRCNARADLLRAPRN